MKVTDETKAMAQKILNYIAENPEQHDQRYFFGDTDAVTDNWCGTTMCIAGTAAWLTHGEAAKRLDPEWEGTKSLGLSFGESQILFYEMSNDRALAKLSKVARGEEFTKEDFYTTNHATDEEPTFNGHAWDDRNYYDL